MRQLANRYNYDIRYSYNDNCEYTEWCGEVYADRGRLYKTKMKPSDLPEYYCDVQRYSTNHDILNARGVKDMIYTWVKENHFMKDSVLRISYTGKMRPYHKKYTIQGKRITSCFLSYENEDEMVFGYDTFKFLAYAKRYSGFNLSKIRKSVIDQCEWLKVNEPSFAPHNICSSNGNISFPDFGEWFDNKIEKYENYSNK